MLDPHPVRHRNAFDPAPYERQLSDIIEEILAAPAVDDRVLDRIVKRHPKDGTGLFSRSEIIAGFRRFAARRTWSRDEAAFLERLRLRPVRTRSGVTPVTVLTKPFPCPGKCVFCPNDARMPKSYLASEPGAQRAAANDFDPYRQTWSRIAAYQGIGHPVDKLELIILGGTWSFYPEPYQVWFVKRCFDAMNDFGAGIDRRSEAAAASIAARAEGRATAVAAGPHPDRAAQEALARTNAGHGRHPAEAASWPALERAQRANESAACRNVGLSVETRPDHVTEDELRRIRRLGATKVQIGLQSLSDPVLDANRRGHDVAASRRALRLLRAAGFKIQAHWMPNLLGATAESDAQDFARLFEDADFRPDELKIYPCSLVESAELMAHYRRGDWRPYDARELLAVLTESLALTPAWCRLSRVIRDFSAGDIVAGNRVANLREVAERALGREGRACRDIRAREIRNGSFLAEETRLSELRYETSIGGEVFLQWVTRDDRLLGFLRLSLPRNAPAPPELRDCAVIREVHVYGASLALGRRAPGAAQHSGLGRRLVERACEVAAAAGHRRVAVISAVGTRAYYRDLGFRDGELYQHRAPARRHGPFGPD